MKMQRLVVVERVHEDNDKDYLFGHKHHKFLQIPSDTSKIVVINILEILIPWSG
jgi:hypothetical protein